MGNVQCGHQTFPSTYKHTSADASTFIGHSMFSRKLWKTKVMHVQHPNLSMRQLQDILMQNQIKRSDNHLSKRNFCGNRSPN